LFLAYGETASPTPLPRVCRRAIKLFLRKKAPCLALIGANMLAKLSKSEINSPATPAPCRMVVCKVAKRQGKRKEIFKKEPFQTKEPANKQNVAPSKAQNVGNKRARLRNSLKLPSR